MQIKAGSAAEPNFHPHLQEPIPATPLQPPRLLNEVHAMQLDMLIQRTAQPEPPPALPLREQLGLHGKWARKSRFMRPMTFSRPLFPTSFMRTLNEWGMMLPPRVTQPKDWLEQWAAAQHAHTASQVKGGFGSPSGPNYRLTASALPQD